ncbi:MAG: hypothetical protein ACLQVD_15265, partial [Capsulimonadaceae bacterium]
QARLHSPSVFLDKRSHFAFLGQSGGRFEFGATPSKAISCNLQLAKRISSRVRTLLNALSATGGPKCWTYRLLNNFIVQQVLTWERLCSIGHSR